jgi:hypothetical protein
MKNIHILPTDKPSRLIIYSTLLNEFRLLDKPIEDWKHKKNIYITNDEEIKEGDYGILGKTILSYHQMHKKWGMPQGLKIILTTDQDLIKDGVQAIDDEFIEWFVKNPSCEEVEVRYSVDFNSKAIIIIPKEEPKQETIEEAFDRIFDSIDYILFDFASFEQGAKWQQEQYKNKYSEKIIDILDNVRYWETCPDEYKVIIENFIEQFKNK